MPFNSPVFIFIFLPIAIFLFNLFPSGWIRKIIFLTTSFIFYAWGEPILIFLLITLTLTNWLLAIWIGKLQKGTSRTLTDLVSIIAIFTNLLPLIIFKLNNLPNFDLSDILNLEGTFSDLSFPLGLSFFSFSAISYIVDISREEVTAEKNLINFANFMFMFPKMLQGPITRMSEVRHFIEVPKTSINGMAEGFRRFMIGFAKKAMIADYLAAITNKIFALDAASLHAGLAWYGLVAFAVQIYLDFSGYTDMALGIGKIFGISLPENFNFPYMSRSITDFWRRWHMSLTSWFRNYIFIPLEISRRKSKFFRQETNLLIVFFATGLWHGVTWNFIIWGVYFGIIIVLESVFLSEQLKKIPPIFQHFYSLVLILIGWVFFRLEDLNQWGPFLRSLFQFSPSSRLDTLLSLNLLVYFPLLILGLLTCTKLFHNLYEQMRSNKAGAVFSDIILIVLFILSVSNLISGNYQAFLYSTF